MSTLFLEREIHPFDILFRNLFESNTHFKPAVESKIPHPLDIYEDKEGLHFEIACTGLSKEDVNIDIITRELKRLESSTGGKEAALAFLEGQLKEDFNQKSLSCDGIIEAVLDTFDVNIQLTK